jgi:MFS family permease
MGENDELQQKLVSRIKARRLMINQFAGELGRRGDRLVNLSIMSTAVTTVLVSGPALGGGKFTEGLQNLLGLPSDTWVWRALCFVAAILSVVAAITSNMYKSHDVASRLATAQSTSVLLEGLETALEFGQLPLDEATRRFREYLAQVPFIEEKSSESTGAGSSA